ncbi:MAG: DUF2249 domain-containing protein [Ignavibacteriaceae bacterium]|nr:DUF2249 domain-containing protein [Ignavibacteriaceae bacterium]
MSETNSKDLKPEFLKTVASEKIKELDVRPILSGGQDPFSQIMAAVSALSEGDVLLLINTFEPLPLYKVLARQGFEHYTELDGDEYHIYFWQTETPEQEKAKDLVKKGETSDQVVIELDVRELEPPEPMIKILEKLTTLPECAVLLVHHHREPVMLYPKLEENGFEATANRIAENYYKVLISRKKQ